MVFRLPDARVHYPGQGTALITLPQDSQTPMPVVIAIHGAGRSALDYRDTPFYMRQQQIAREQGCQAVTLNVWYGNDALKFYEKCGMKPQKIGMEYILC